MSKAPKRKRNVNSRSAVAMVLVTIGVIVLAIVVGLRVNSLQEKENQYLEKEAALLAQIAEQEERAEKLEEYRVYVQTKQYIEKEAKEKLGLVNPDEILLKPNK